MADVGARPIAAGAERGVVVWSHARALVGTFRPQSWVVLHDLVFDAEWVDDRWRCLGELGDPAVTQLAQRGCGSPRIDAQMLSDQPCRARRNRGSAGRFGLASYTLRLPSGIEVLSPCVNLPHTATAHTVEPGTAPHPVTAQSLPRPSGRRRAAARQWTQDALDFGTGDA